MVVGTDASRRDRAKGRSDRWTSVALPSDLRGDSGAPYSSMNLASRGCQPMDRDKRPLSPHIQIYRPQWSSVLSIMHRITGLLLALGSLILTWWLTAIASGPEAFGARSEEHTSELQSLMRISYAVFCLQKKMTQ